DRSPWGEAEGEQWVTFEDYDGQIKSLQVEDVADLVFGGHWDESSWDYFFWVGGEGPEAHPFRAGSGSIADLYERLWINARSRLAATALAVGNYQTREEMERWTKSERLDVYALPVAQRMHLERLVESVVRAKEPDVDVYRLRLYKSAVLQIFAVMGSPHRWGNEAIRGLTEEEFRAWWLDTWEAKGLRRDVLEALYSELRKYIDTFVSRRLRERIRFLSKRLVSLR
ncbi:MAG: hypothetical protein DRJ38_06255, partial [Thermoprotei archaeon]